MGASYIIPDIFPNGKRVFVFAACRQRGAFGWTCGPGTIGGGGLFAAVRGGGRQFGSGRDLPAGSFRPHASYLRKEARCRASAKKLPKGTPWKGFLWTPPETEGPRSLWHPGAARYRDFPSRALLRTFERSIVGGTTDLLDPTWRKANFLWKFLCAGSPPARIFAEQKCLAAAKDCRFAARQLDR